MTTNPNLANVPAIVPAVNPVVASVPTPTAPVTVSLSHAEKPEKFYSLNFKRWQQKMLFYLTILNLVRFLAKDALSLKEDEQDIQVISAVDA